MRHDNYQIRQPKKMRCVAFLMFLFSYFLIPTIGAQTTFTQRLQRSAQGEGTVTLHQDAAIDALVNGSQPAAVAPPKKTVAEKPATPAAEKPREKSPVAEAHAAPRESSEPAPDTTAVRKLTGRTYKVTGYRVQAFAGGNTRKDKQQAEQTGNQLRMLFPAESVYTHFYSPRWICRIGNYRTYEEAHQMLQEVKKLGFTSATIVKGKISVPY